MEDQLQRRIELFLKESRWGHGIRTDGYGAAVGTTIGSVRNDNQDRALVVEGRYAEAPERDFILAVVCDGMGGMSQGGDAAVLALSTFVARVLRHGRAPSDERLDQAARIADRVVHSKLHGRGGTTLTAVLIERNGKATGLNLGDSRLYHIIHDEIRQLSRDDTLGEYLRREHGASIGSNHRHEILQFVGIGEGFTPHLIRIATATKNSSLLLTTDGAHDVPQEVLTRVITGSTSNSDVVSKLLKLSDIMGGRDNATAIALPHVYVNTPATFPLGYGMTFRFWSPFTELEIWIPTAADRAQGPLSPDLEGDQPVRSQQSMVADGGEFNAGYSKRKRKRRPRDKGSKSAARDTDEKATPKLDIDFPKSE